MVGTMHGYDDYKKEVDMFNENVHSRGTKFWVFAVSRGRWVDIGYKDTEAEAYQMAYAECPDKHFEIVPLSTTDIAEAHRRFKKRILEKHHDLDSATALISRKTAEKAKTDTDNGDLF